MAGAPAPDNREPAMADIHLLPRRIALLLLLADLIGLILAFNLANWLRLGSLLGLPFDILLPIAVLVLALYVLDCYSVESQVAGMRAAPRTLVAVLLGAIVTAAAIYASGLWGSGNSTVGRGVMPVAYLIFAQQNDPDAGVWVTDFKTPPRPVFRGPVCEYAVDEHSEITILKGNPDLSGELWKVKWDGSGLSRAAATIPLLYNFNYLRAFATNQFDISPDGRRVVFQSQQVLQENIGIIDNLP